MQADAFLDNLANFPDIVAKLQTTAAEMHKDREPPPRNEFRPGPPSPPRSRIPRAGLAIWTRIAERQSTIEDATPRSANTPGRVSRGMSARPIAAEQQAAAVADAT